MAEIKLFSSKGTYDCYAGLDEFLKLSGTQDIPYVNTIRPDINSEDIVVSIVHNNMAIAMLVIHIGSQPSVNGTGACSWISSVGVHPSYQGRGLSKVLIKAFFKLASIKKYGMIEQSTYTTDGELKIKKTFNQIRKEYPDVMFIDPSEDTMRQYVVES